MALSAVCVVVDPSIGRSIGPELLFSASAPRPLHRNEGIDLFKESQCLYFPSRDDEFSPFVTTALAVGLVRSVPR